MSLHDKWNIIAPTKNYIADQGGIWQIMGIAIFFLEKDNLDIRSYESARLD